MGSQDFLVSRYYAAEPTAGRVVDDGPIGIRIKDVAGGTSTPTVAFSSTSSVLTIVDSDATSTAIDLSAAAYNTIGEVVDKINSTAGFECKLLDALRSDASDNVFVDGSVTAATVEGELVFDCKMTTDATDSLTYRVTYDRGVALNRPKGSHRVILTRFTYNADVSAAEAGAVRIYKWDAANKTETLVWQATSVDGAGSGANDTTHTFASGLSAGEGNDLIVRIMDSTSITDNAANFLQCEYTRE